MRLVQAANLASIIFTMSLISLTIKLKAVPAISQEKRHLKLYQNCLTLVQRFAQPHRELRKHLFEKSSAPILSSDSNALSNFNQQSCLRKNIKITLKQIISTYKKPIKNIVFIWPQNSPYDLAIKNIEAGIQLTTKNGIIKPPQNIQYTTITVPFPTTPREFLQRLAQAVFQHDAHLIIGGVTQQNAQLMVEWSNKLALPMIILNDKVNVRQTNRYALKAAPSHLQLFEALSEDLLRRNFKKISVVLDKRHKVYQENSLREILNSKQIELATLATYTTHQFASLEAAMRQVLHTGPNERIDEYRNMLFRAKHKAKKQGVPFNPRTVVLPAKIDFDALYIDGNFKTVRYFIKLMQSMRADSVPLYGNSLWRAQGLLIPYDSYLDGARFFDFLGSYIELKKMAPQIKVTRSPYFTDIEEAERIDYISVGLKVGYIMLITLNHNVSRRKLPSYLAKFPTPGGLRTLFDNTLVNQHFEFNHRMYLFMTQNQQLSLLPYHKQVNSTQGLSAK